MYPSCLGDESVGKRLFDSEHYHSGDLAQLIAKIPGHWYDPSMADAGTSDNDEPRP
jgi:hypothetical protein